jgi:hypothetical protein
LAIDSDVVRDVDGDGSLKTIHLVFPKIVILQICISISLASNECSLDLNLLEVIPFIERVRSHARNRTAIRRLAAHDARDKKENENVKKLQYCCKSYNHHSRPQSSIKY